MPPKHFPLLMLVLTTVLVSFGEWTAHADEVSKKEAARSDTGNANAPTFDTVIKPLFQAKCVRCHGREVRKADLDLSSLRGILKGGESGAVIAAGKLDESPLYEKVHSGEMPPDEKDRLRESEVTLIGRWIEAGFSLDVARHESEAKTDASQTLTQHDVFPILLRRCAACHGRNRQEASLDLRTKATLLRGGKSGPAIVPGKPDESLLIRKLRERQMPPLDRLVEASIKPIEPNEIETLARWIAVGAPEVEIAPDVAGTTPDPLVSDADRDFWSFKPPRDVVVPTVRDAAHVRNPIDSFILQKLEEKGLALAPEVDRLTLLRRASFDLTGLPPEPAEVEAFLNDRDPDAWPKLIDRLLDSPRYGERWGRYWLDVAGYADSEGKREQDLPRPNAWRYRDYVIRSFNADKPFDRFLLEQTAGDELADYEHAPEITTEIYDNLVATAFLRLAPDASWANITGYLQDRVEVIADEMDVLGSAVLGLSLKCARCHSHKFDPIPQRDYFRLLAIFKGAYDEHDWLKPDVRPGIGPVSQDVIGGRLLPFVTTVERREWEAQQTRISSDIADIRTTLDRKAKTLTEAILEERLQQLPEGIREDVRAMLAIEPAQRNAAQKALAEQHEKTFRISRDDLKTLNAEFKKDADEADARVRILEAQRQPEPRIQALWDRGEPTPTYIYRRGDPLHPGTLVGPGVPSVLTDGRTPFDVKPPWPGAKQTGRRLAFARWLIKPDHPLTARVRVNQIWKHHFGTGLVRTLGNFGRTGTPPTHPELLDWLSREFVRRGWSIKAMHRLMMTSATYRQSSNASEALQRDDPDNVLYSRMPMTRLDAEALYDTLLLVSGRLDETRFGPADGVQARPDGLVTPNGSERGWRRLIYVRQARKQVVTHLENFDFPQMNPNCIERRDSLVAPQALHLTNNGMVYQLAERFAVRVSSDAGDDLTKQIERASLIALSRPPDEEELRIGMEALRQLTEIWLKQMPASDPAGESAAFNAARSKALTAYCHALMNSAAFLYVD